MLNKKIDILLLTKKSRHSTTGFYVMNDLVDNINFKDKGFSTKSFGFYSVACKIKWLKSILTLLKTFLYAIKLAVYLCIYRPRLVYFTISPVKAFIRDLTYVCILKLFRIDVIYHLHGKGIIEKYGSGKLYASLYNWAYSKANVISLSKKLDYDFDFLPIRQSFVLPNVIPHNACLKSERNDKESLKVVWLSNMIKSKGIQDFIRAVKISLDRGVGIEASIIGAAYDYSIADLQEEIRGYKDHFQYHGALYDKEKQLALARADIFIFPTYMQHETWGLVILEAMQQGLVVMATDEGGITDMIEDGVNGFIIEKQNPQAISDKLKVLNENPQLIEEMGKQNRQKVIEKFSPEAFEDKISQIFMAVLENN